MKYLILFAKTFKACASYRASMWGNLIFSLLGFLVTVSLWSALIATGVRTDVTVSDLMFYSLVSSTVRWMCSCDVAVMLEDQIRDGSVSMHFLRPISFRRSLVATVLGENAFFMLLGQIPLLIAAVTLIGLPAPAGIMEAGCFALSAVLGMLILFELYYAVGLLAFWLQQTWFLGRYVNAGFTLFGGATVPLWFFPEALNAFTRFLPFRYIHFEAINMYLGRMTQQEMLVSLLISLAWLTGLRLLSAYGWHRAQRKLTINGG